MWGVCIVFVGDRHFRSIPTAQWVGIKLRYVVKIAIFAVKGLPAGASIHRSSGQVCIGREIRVGQNSYGTILSTTAKPHRFVHISRHGHAGDNGERWGGGGGIHCYIRKFNKQHKFLVPVYSEVVRF